MNTADAAHRTRTRATAPRLTRRPWLEHWLATCSDLSELKAARADIDISGAGSATVGPTDSARVQISGMGDVNLLTRPKQLETHVSGAGRIRQPGQDSFTAGDDGDDDNEAGRGPGRST